MPSTIGAAGRAFRSGIPRAGVRLTPPARTATLSAMTDAADRTARLMALVIERSPRTVAEMIAACEASEADVRFALAALERHGLVHWDANGAQVRSAYARQDLSEVASAAMRRLADESGETVNLMVRSANGAEAVAQVDGRHVLGVSSWLGREVPDHCSAAGKVFLAFGASAPREPLARLTARTIVHPDQLRRELEQTRAQGFAAIVDELEMGLAAVAAPIRDGAGAVVGALSGAGPTARRGPSRLGVVGRLAIEQADGVSARLGYAGG
jgi:IclR family acetate operon transcriptional repressor